MPRIYSKKEILILKEGGKKLAQIVKILGNNIQEKKSAIDVDKLAYDLMIKEGGKPSFLNHEGFPSSTCISINDEVVHSAPTKEKFRQGDIVGIDAGLLYKGLHTDMAVTVPVGNIDKKTLFFLDTAKGALEKAIEVAKPGNTIGHLGEVIQKFVEERKFSIVRELSGHGVGSKLHEEPTIPNFGVKGKGEVLKPGMVLAIEPIINMGSREVETAIDGWRVKTKDSSLSAHFEHTIVITENGNEILTKI
ncbi:MAG: type I methionyl aminopeptidase [Candidatus Berkelbacteria bacterium]|nr:type I methionyl aminopeptidase [Candidatus Berkelbacteria bacterium]